MRIAVIARKRYREYLMDVFARHPEFGADIVCFAIDEKIVCFEDWLPEEQTYRDIPIVPVSELRKKNYDAVLIAVDHNHDLSRLLTWLHDENLENIYIIRLYALDTSADFIAGTCFDAACVDKMPGPAEKPYLVHLETHVCDHCNLNCKACNAFSPFVRERRVTNIEHYERDLRRLTELFSAIGRFHLLGGEPLLEPEHSCEMLKITRRYFPNTELSLTTNATLISKMTPAFWDCLRECGVVLRISVYPPVLERLEEIEAILQKNKITYLLGTRVQTFSKYFSLSPFEDVEVNNQKCNNAGCHYLRDGVISKCPDGLLVDSMLPALKHVTDSLGDRSPVNIAEEKDSWEIIRRLDGPGDACRSCAKQRKKLIPWEPSGASTDPFDWLVEDPREI